MAADRIESYADHYVQSTERHPMEVLAGIIERRGWSKRRIGVEMDNYYFSAKAFAVLQERLPNAGFHDATRSEEHTSELQSLMRNSYAVFCLKKKNNL